MLLFSVHKFGQEFEWSLLQLANPSLSPNAIKHPPFWKSPWSRHRILSKSKGTQKLILFPCTGQYPRIPGKNKTICDSYCNWISPGGYTLRELSKLHQLSYISGWFAWLHVFQFVFWLNIHRHRPRLERCLLYISNFHTANTWQTESRSALDIISTHTHTQK